MRHAPSQSPGETLIPLVFGICSILIGVLALLLLVLQPTGELAFAGLGDSRIRISGGSGLQSKQIDVRLEVTDPRVQLALDRRPPLQRHTADLADALVTGHWIVLLLGLLLLGVGPGQVAYRAWGRIAAIGWSLCALLALVAIVGIVLTGVVPALEGMCQNVNLVADGKFSSDTCDASGHLVALIPGLVLAPFPVATLLLFRRQRVVAAMYR